MTARAHPGFRTEIEFELPKGYVDEDGNLHRRGVMRLATAAGVKGGFIQGHGVFGGMNSRHTGFEFFEISVGMS